MSRWYKDGSPSNDSLSLSDAQFAATNLGFIKALLKVTGRPSKTIISGSFCAQWPLSASMAKGWAGKVCEVISTCRQQKKSITSGAKTPPAFIEIIKSMEQWAKSSPSPLPSASASPSPRRLLDTEDVHGLYGGPSSSSNAVLPIPIDLASNSQHAEAAEEESAESDCIMEPEAVEPSAVQATDTFDWSALVLKRYHTGTAREPESASMSHGPKGFAVATFLSGETVTTECTNAMLVARDAMLKKSAAAPVPKRSSAAKRPAAAAKRTAAGKRPAAARHATKPPRRCRGKQGMTVKHDVSLIPRNVQLRHRFGCPKCRNVPFCTFSCYKYRNELAEDVE